MVTNYMHGTRRLDYYSVHVVVVQQLCAHFYNLAHCYKRAKFQVHVSSSVKDNCAKFNAVRLSLGSRGSRSLDTGSWWRPV